ncbi:hypothetical protein PEC311524_26900 [Pectobacterium carotovorum subsp. carotovorum]|nr:hypothetical protein PEC311524_26900 [Pectobacterium carotovorum subsp. carotovorum]
MKKIDLKYNTLTKEDLKKHTKDMTQPCIFFNFPLNKKLSSCSVEHILSLKEKKFLSSIHNGSYWSDKPLYAEVQGRNKKLDLESMFLDNNGDYYVTYFRSTLDNPTGWKTIRTCGNNDFDNFLAEKTEFMDYMRGSDLHNHWVSNGKTLSLLHADPVDTLFLQIKGVKTFRLIPESYKISLLADFKQPHKLKHNIEELKKNGISILEIDIHPGTAVFMPAWCFHEIESKNEGLNISLTSHYPRKRKLYEISPFQIINKFRRFIYPKIVNKKRIKFQLSNLSPDSIPFFPWFSSYVSNNNFKYDTTFQHKHFLINRVKVKITPINNDFLNLILNEVDGYKSIYSISKDKKIEIDKLLNAFKQLVEDEFIQILFESNDKYNYFYQSIEPKNIYI